MNTSLAMADPLAARMLAQFDVRADGQVTPRLRGGRRRRRFQRRAWLRKLLA